MPPLPPELKLLLDNLIAQIQQQQARNDALHTSIQGEIDKLKQATEIDALRTTQSVQQEQIRAMSEEIEKLSTQLEKMQETILKNQQDNFRRTIAVQGSILFLILTTVIGVAVKFLFG